MSSGCSERGSISVEFALVLPLVLLTLLAVVQTAVVMRAHLMVAQAAREGARQATTANNDGEIVKAANQAAGGVAGNGLTVSWNTPEGGRAGCPIVVSAATKVPCLFPLLSSVFPNGFAAKAESTMRLERDR
jgi:Flp pilus assembly protein TadG